MSVIKHLVFLVGTLAIAYLGIVYPIMAFCISLDTDTFTWALLGRCVVMAIIGRPVMRIWIGVMGGREQ